MRGVILGVHDGRGVLSDAGQRRLEFPLTEWRSAGAPAAGLAVDFVEQDGEARSVFAVPMGAQAAASGPVGTHSNSYVLSAVALACLVIGFFIPFIPTVAAFVLGVISAQAAQREGDSSALLMARIAWIGAIILLGVGILALMAIVMLFGGVFGLAHLFTLGPGDLGQF